MVAKHKRGDTPARVLVATSSSPCIVCREMGDATSAQMTTGSPISAWRLQVTTRHQKASEGFCQCGGSSRCNEMACGSFVYAARKA